jgi:ribosomal protein S27AE
VIKGKICPVCGELHHRILSEFCTPCQRKGYSQEKKKVCPICGKSFYARSKNHLFCSYECQKTNWAKNNPDYYNGKFSSGWLKIRFEVFKRDNFTCQYCGRNVIEDGIKLECDHIFPRGKGGKIDPPMEELVTSCFECNQGKKDFLLSDRVASKLIDYNSRKAGGLSERPD